MSTSTTRRIIIAFTAKPAGSSRGRPRRQSVAVEIPIDATDIQCAVQIPVGEQRETAADEHVQVLLPGSKDPFVFRCPDAKIGDRVAVPNGQGAPYITNVVGLGRGAYSGPTKTATLIKD